MRRLRLLETKGPIHHWLQLPAEYVFQHLVQFAHGPHVRAEDGQLAGIHKSQIHTHVRPGGGSAGDESARWAQRLHAFLPGGFADMFHDNIHPTPGGNSPHFFGDLPGVVIDDVIGPQLPRQFSLAVVARGGDHRGVEELRHLNAGNSHAGVGAQHQHRLSRANPGPPHQHVPRRQEHQRNAGRFVEAQVVGNRDDVDRGHCDQLTISAIRPVAQHAVLRTLVLPPGAARLAVVAEAHRGDEHALPGTKPGHVFAHFDNLPGHVAPRNMWQGRFRGPYAHPDIQVVEGAGLHPYQDLILARPGVGYIFKPQHLRSPVFVHDNGFHGFLLAGRSTERRGKPTKLAQPSGTLGRRGFDFPLPPAAKSLQMDIYEEIVKLRQQGRRGAVATIVNVRGSIPSFKTAKMLVRDDGSILGTIGGGCVEAEVWQAAREVMESEKPRTMTFNLNQDPKYDTGLVCGGTLDIFIEPILPVAELYLFGAGHVSLNVSKAASRVGFDVTVIDDRETYANRERFPDAKEVIAEDFERATASLAVTESSYIVIVTRGHRDDMRVLRWAVQTPARYIGMIGSKRKTVTIFRELQKEGLAAGLFDSVHAPIGLDIGAVTPEEIAISITAELIGIRRRVERPLPHMSWFHNYRNTTEVSVTEDSPHSALDVEPSSTESDKEK